MNPPKMPIHIGDFLRDTAHLRAAGTGAYALLLFYQWSTGSLPADDEQLATIAKLSKAEWTKMRPTLQKFFGERWHHGRVEKDLATAKANYEARAKAGAEGGKAKAKAKQNPSNATAQPEQCSSYLIPLTKEQKDAADAAPPYPFESGVIRLNQRDFDQWREAFSYLDVAAELLSLTEWAGQQRSWFNAVKGALAKRNRDVKAEKQRLAEQGGFKWNGGIEGVV